MLKAGSFLWDLISGFWNLTSHGCQVTVSPDKLELGSHENHPSAKVFERGHIRNDQKPSFNFV
jgi:dienelactone hydrolase